MERKFVIKLLVSLGLPLLALVSLASFDLINARHLLQGYTLLFAGYLAVAASLATMRRHLMLTRTRLQQVKTMAERIAQGHFDRLPMEADDELVGLATVLNSMRDVMAAREQSLREETLALTVVNRRMAAILDATDDGLGLIDAAGYLVLVNRRFCEMMGMRRDNLLLHRVDDIQDFIIDRFIQPEKMLRALTPTSDPNSGVYEDTIEISKDHSFFQLYTAPTRDDNRDISGQIIALHDMTREKELDKMKTEFISVVSHELRTPLTSIKGYTDILLTEQAGEINEIQREFLGILQGSANRLSNLINDILDISRIESGRIDVKQDAVDYSRIVGDTLRLMKAAADEKDIMLDASMPAEWPKARGDTDKIGQILTNLLSNAIKYTPNGGFVKLMIEVNEEGYTTCIADSGIGISADDQKKLFQKFFRADNSLTREAGGTGLGLVIVKTMVELLGGSIWVDSEVGRGSKFYFTLPVYAEKAASEVDAVTDNSPPRPASDRGLGMVLVVDNETMVRDQLQHALHRRGYAVTCASNADEVIPRARGATPNVVLLDMMLGATGSLKVLRDLHASPLTKNVPVVAYSLSGDPIHGKLSLSAYSFLRKPLDAEVLAKELTGRAGSQESPKVLFVCCDASEDEEQIRANEEAMRRAGIVCSTALTATQAITRVVSDPPDVVVIDIDRTADASLFELMRALKSEEDIARIPVVIEAAEITTNDIHFHLGAESLDASAAIDYLVEQVTQVMR